MMHRSMMCHGLMMRRSSMMVQSSVRKFGGTGWNLVTAVAGKISPVRRCYSI